jgi:polar amino acid transport system substrate-binding protein
MISRRRLAGAAGSAALAGWLRPALAADAENTLRKIRRTGKLRTGGVASQAPYSDKDPVTGAWRGFMIDLARDLAKQLGVTLEVVETNWGNAVLDLQSDRVDIFFGLNPTPQRLLAVDFTKPLFTNAFTLIARPGFDRATWESLNDPEVKIAVQVGTSYDEFVAKSLPKASVTRLQTANEATLHVQSRRADCQVIVLVLALTIVKRNPGLGHVIVPTPLYGATTNAAIRREPDKEWQSYVDDWITRARDAGRVRDAVIRNLQLVGVEASDIPPQVVF